MKKFFSEFKKFITRGNVIDMAVGVIVGSSFTAIVNGMSNYILKPVINWLLAVLLGKDSLSDLHTFLVKVEKSSDILDAEGNVIGTESVIDLAESIYIDWGAFISAIINFLLIALVLFAIVRAINFANSEVARAKTLGGALSKEEIKALRKQGKSRKEIKAIQQQRLADVAEQARLAAEEAAKNAPKTEQQLLAEIVELLKDQQK